MRFAFHTLFLLTVLVACSAYAGRDLPGFERYQSIIAAKPFGEVTATSAPPTPLAAAVSFAKNFRLSALIDDEEGGVRVGLYDTASKKDYLLSVGDVEDGIELVSASYAEEEAVLRKGEEMAIIKFQSGEVLALTQEQQVAREKAQKAAVVPSVAISAPTNNGSADSYIKRRRAREAQRQALVAPPPPAVVSTQQAGMPNGTNRNAAAADKEIQRRLQEYQMEIIRQGLPPLPIPLTEEMDDQLVSEGYLPPREQ